MLTRFATNCCRLSFLLLFLGWGLFAKAQNNPPLARGQWFKVGVTQTGVYKLSAAYLKQEGVISAATNPKHIQVYGQGGGMLPQPNAASRPDGLQEKAIFIAGEEDNHFNESDYVLFYAQGPDKYAFDPAAGEIIYEKNLYSDTAFYFLTVGEAPGKRMRQQANLSVSGPTLHTYTAYAALEEDTYNLLNSGRRWLGDRFSGNTSKEYLLSLPPLKPDTDLFLKTAFVAADTGRASFSLSVNGLLAQEVALPAIRNPKKNPYAEKGFLVEQSSTLSMEGQAPVSLTVSYQGSSGSGYLDYIFATGTAPLQYRNAALLFRSLESLQHPLVRYELSGAAAGMKLWDVSDPQDARIQTYEQQGERLTFGAHSSGLREFIAFTAADALTPVSVQQTANQHLRGDRSPELVIITHPSLLPEADRLARFRRENDGLAVKVVTTEQVYNEFSSGAQDVTALRDYARFLYQSGGAFRYLLLFGRGYFDYKQRKEKPYNLVPVYESYNFTDPVKSYASDDYFGFLEDEEGAWKENEQGNHSLDIGIGRLPVVDLAEARRVVDKLIHYQKSSETYGSWRNRLLFIADDGDSNIHQRDADNLAQRAENAWPEANISKVYLGAFPQDKVANGERSPKAIEAVNQAIEKGAFVVNYTGHGSLDLLTEEFIITKSGIEQWQNKHCLPLVVTATCEFGQHDNTIRSGAESMLLNPHGGAIGLLTTARPVYSHTNFEINNAFYDHLFPTGGQAVRRLGDIVRLTKNQGMVGTGVINRNFLLLGDPSMKLSYPKNRATITQLSNKAEDTTTDTLKAFSEVKASGVVLDGTGEVDSSFDGLVEAVVFEKPVVYETIDPEVAKMQFTIRNNVIFRGRATVTKGHFSFGFTVPKSIRYTPGEGKISLYAVSADSLMDAGGEHRNFIIGGSKRSIQADNSPPRVGLFLNDSSFRDGGRVGAESWLLAYFQDENGINITNTGVHEGIVASLNGETTFLLNDYYSAAVDDHTRGSLRFPLQGLPAGEHTLSLTARDTHNNLSTSEISFVVSEREAFSITRLYNYPNPVQNQTSFVVTHNRAGVPLEVILRVYKPDGRLVFERISREPNSLQQFTLEEWDGRSGAGQKLARGMYLFKILLRSLSDGSTTEKSEKLVILN